MKRFLITKQLLIFTLLMLSFSSFRVTANERIQYYHELVNSWVGADYISFALDQNSSLASHYSIFNGNKDARYLVVSTTILDKIKLLPKELELYQKVVIVCDTAQDFNFQDQVACNHGSVQLISNIQYSANAKLIDLDNSLESLPIFLGKLQSKSTNYFLIPESYLANYTKSNKIGHYFKAIEKSSRTSEKTVKNELSESNILYARSSFLSFLLAFSSILCFVLVGKSIYALSSVSAPKSMGHSESAGYRWTFLVAYLVIGTAAFLFFLKSLFSQITATGIISGNLERLITIIVNNRLFNKIFLLFVLFLINVLVLAAAPQRIFESIQESIKSLRHKKITVFGSTVVSPLLVLVLAFFLATSNSFNTISYLCVGLLIVLSWLGLPDTETFPRILRARRFLFLGVFTMVFVFLFLLKIKTLQEYNMVALFGDGESMITSPVFKFVNRDTRYLDLPSAWKFPIYVNSFLVYHPDYLKIENIPAKNYSYDPTLPVLISVDDVTAYTDILSNKNLIPVINQKNSSGIFLLESPDQPNFDNIRLFLTFDCTKPRSDFDVSINVYSLLKTRPQTTRLMHFPGCTGSEGNVQYTFDYDPLSHGNYPFLYILSEDARKYITEVKLESSGKALPIQHLKDPLLNRVLYETPDPRSLSDTLSVYTLGSKEYFYIERKPGIYNLSSGINTLIDKNLVDGAIKIWSIEPNIIFWQKR